MEIYFISSVAPLCDAFAVIANCSDKTREFYRLTKNFSVNSGLRCVLCEAVGVVDCLTDNVNGLLVQPGDINALADAGARILEDAELRVRFTEAVYKDAHEKNN